MEAVKEASLLTGSTKTFYAVRRLGLVALCLVPLLLLAGAWWVVAEVVLAPPVPDDSASPEECVAFIAHDKGLPRLDPDQAAAFLESQCRRALRDRQWAEALLAAFRRSVREEQKAVRAHLFDALKPRLLQDAKRYQELSGPARDEFLDQRLVDGKRMGALQSLVRDGSAGASFDQTELVELLLTRVSDQERSLGAEYVTALARRREQIRADHALEKAFEARVAANP